MITSHDRPFMPMNVFSPSSSVSSFGRSTVYDYSTYPLIISIFDMKTKHLSPTVTSFSAARSSVNPLPCRYASD